MNKYSFKCPHGYLLEGFCTHERDGKEVEEKPVKYKPIGYGTAYFDKNSVLTLEEIMNFFEPVGGQLEEKPPTGKPSESATFTPKKIEARAKTHFYDESENEEIRRIGKDLMSHHELLTELKNKVNSLLGEQK